MPRGVDGTYVRVRYLREVFTRSLPDRCKAVLNRNWLLPSVASMDLGSPALTKPQLVVYAAAVLAVALIGARYLQSASGEVSRASAPPAVSGATGATGGYSRSGSVMVHVAGAVRRPGVYRLNDGDRVADAVDEAGGWAPGADRSAVNLAARLADGQQVVIARRGAAGASGSAGPISLASATAEQLDGLEGIGPGLAQKIVEQRTQRGGFSSVDDLVDVPGIGEKRLESLRTQLQP